MNHRIVKCVKPARYQRAFALPTVLIASIILLTVLLSSVTAVSSIRTALNDQYYNQLAQEAAESGVAFATACLKGNGYVPTWGANPLKPNTDCTGTVVGGLSPYVLNKSGVQTSFSVPAPTTGTGGFVQVNATARLDRIRTSSSTVWQSYNQSIVNIVKYSDAPKISGGAGWKDNGHLGAIMSTSGQVYGYGANSLGQVLGVTSPAAVALPYKMALPPGVNRVTQIKSSGQGASFICIIGDNSRVYCQGAAGAGEDGLMATTMGWQEFGPGVPYNAVDMYIKGYGPDGMCVLTDTQRAYCAGENYFGTVGNGDTTYSIYKISNPQEFVVKDSGGTKLTLKKVYMFDDITCAITTASDLYCVGLNWYGQIAGASTNGTGNGSYATVVKYPMPAGRKVQDVVSSYHGSSNTMHVLATDGTIWSSGLYNNGELGNGQTSGNTGATQTPALFTDSNVTYATGSIFWNQQSNRCIDNYNGLAVPGNKIQLFDCAGPNTGQNWVYGSNRQLTNLGTGMCLDDPGNSSNPGTYLQLYTCNGTPAQQFVLKDGIGIYHPSSGLCADALNGGTANGTVIQLWTCGAGTPNTNPAQRFTTWQGINGWKGMIAGTDHFCAMRQDQWSGMWCAGSNVYGQLANISSTGNNFPSPSWTCQPIAGSGVQMFNVNLPNNVAVDVTKLSSEWQQQFLSTMVIGTDGKVYGSGRNQYGKLGNGALGDPANDYRQCTTVQFALPAGVTAVDMSTRDEYTTYVLGSDGKIYAAGRNNNGQVGDGTTTDRLTPVEVQVPRSSISF